MTHNPISIKLDWVPVDDIAVSGVPALIAWDAIGSDMVANEKVFTTLIAASRDGGYGSSVGRSPPVSSTTTVLSSS